MRRYITCVILLLSMMVMFVGCDLDDRNKNEQLLDTSNISQDTSLITYLPSADGMYLISKEIFVPAQEKTPKNAIQAMIALDEKEKYPILPRNVQVYSVTVNGKVAEIDFNSALVENISGGSSVEMMVVYMVVDTLTNFDDISEVKFLVEGKDIATLNGHLDLSKPLLRNEDLILK